MKSKRPVLNAPSSLKYKVKDITFIENGDNGLFLLGKYKPGKKLKKNGLVCLKDTSALFGAVVYKDSARVMFDISLKDLKKFIKVVEKQKKKFKTGFFMNYNPELAFYFKD